MYFEGADRCQTFRNVPKYICGDDLGQSTQTQEFVRKGKVWKAGPTSESALVERLHHRLLTDLVGSAMSKPIIG